MAVLIKKEGKAEVHPGFYYYVKGLAALFSFTFLTVRDHALVVKLLFNIKNTPNLSNTFTVLS